MTPQTVPAATFHTRVRNESLGGSNPFEWKVLTSDDVFSGKRIVLFALPGAFTPACSESHLPGFERHYDAFRAVGIDEVISLSVNDAFVMFQWGKHMGVENVRLLPDGSGEFTRKMGMLVDKDNLGFGMRSWRYSAFINDGEVEQLFTEAGYSDNCPSDPFDVSDAQTMLGYLRDQLAAPKVVNG